MSWLVTRQIWGEIASIAVVQWSSPGFTTLPTVKNPMLISCRSTPCWRKKTFKDVSEISLLHIVCWVMIVHFYWSPTGSFVTPCSCGLYKSHCTSRSCKVCRPILFSRLEHPMCHRCIFPNCAWLDPAKMGVGGFKQNNVLIPVDQCKTWA